MNLARSFIISFESVCILFALVARDLIQTPFVQVGMFLADWGYTPIVALFAPTALAIGFAWKALRPGNHNRDLAQWPGLPAYRASVFAGILWMIAAPAIVILGKVVDSDGATGFLGACAVGGCIALVISLLTTIGAAAQIASILDGEGTAAPP